MKGKIIISTRDTHVYSFEFNGREVVFKEIGAKRRRKKG